MRFKDSEQRKDYKGPYGRQEYKPGDQSRTHNSGPGKTTMTWVKMAALEVTRGAQILDIPQKQRYHDLTSDRIMETEMTPRFGVSAYSRENKAGNTGWPKP